MGQYDGDACYILNYAYTVYGVWYSQTALDKLDAEYPEDWDAMLALCAKAKKKGIAGWTYAGKYPYYIPFSLYPFIGKIGGREVLDAIDNLEPNAWKHPAVKAGFEAYYELFKKGYVLKGTPGIDHVESQTAWTQGKALFLPNGSWVENEAVGTTPDDFEMKVAAPSSLDSSDKLPFGTLWASGGEPFIVPKKAKNPDGGMEQLRIMLSESSSKNFTGKVKSLTALDGGTDGLELTSALKSAVAALEKAGENILNPRLQDWYVELQKQRIGSRRDRRDDGGPHDSRRGHEEVPGVRRRGGQGRLHQALPAQVRQAVAGPPLAGPRPRQRGGTRRGFGVDITCSTANTASSRAS